MRKRSFLSYRCLVVNFTDFLCKLLVWFGCFCSYSTFFGFSDHVAGFFADAFPPIIITSYLQKRDVIHSFKPRLRSVLDFVRPSSFNERENVHSSFSKFACKLLSRLYVLFILLYILGDFEEKLLAHGQRFQLLIYFQNLPQHRIVWASVVYSTALEKPDRMYVQNFALFNFAQRVIKGLFNRVVIAVNV